MGRNVCVLAHDRAGKVAGGWEERSATALHLAGLSYHASHVCPLGAVHQVYYNSKIVFVRKTNQMEVEALKDNLLK